MKTEVEMKFTSGMYNESLTVKDVLHSLIYLGVFTLACQDKFFMNYFISILYIFIYFVFSLVLINWNKAATNYKKDVSNTNIKKTPVVLTDKITFGLVNRFIMINIAMYYSCYWYMAADYGIVIVSLSMRHVICKMLNLNQRRIA